jgi:hypothetical protein
MSMTWQAAPSGYGWAQHSGVDGWLAGFTDSVANLV